MTDGKILKAFIHPFAKEIVEITSNNNENTFFKQSETHLLSLLSLYVNRTTNVSQFKEIIIELKSLLEDINTYDDLRKLSDSLLDGNADVKKLWETDAFFHTSEGWEEHDNNVKHMTLLGVKKRIDYLYSHGIKKM